MTSAFRVLLAAAFNTERTWRSRQMRTLKKVGWSWDGNKESDREAVGHNSIPDSTANFICERAADMTPVVWCSHKHLISGFGCGFKVPKPSRPQHRHQLQSR